MESIWLGYDSREVIGFSVARYSIERFNRRIPIYGLVLDDLQQKGWYKRPTELNFDHLGHRILIDVPSRRPDYDGRMSTEFAVSRFMVPLLAREGWALFADSDIMVMENISKLFELADRKFAVMVVKHNHRPKERIKKEGQAQTIYERKNWSSVILFNCEHPANKRLTWDQINSTPALHLHQFRWLEDKEIGELPARWNYLVGESKQDDYPALIHFTKGLPNLPGYENQPFADEWRRLQPYSVGALRNGGNF